MKLGTENRTKTLIALVLTAVAVVALLWSFWPASQTVTETPEARTDQTPAARAGNRPAPRQRSVAVRDRRWAYQLQPTLDPRLRLDLLKETEGTTYEGRGRNIFRATAEPLPDDGPRANTAPPAQAQRPPERFIPQGPPPPPPIDLRFYGWASRPGEPKRIFLSQQGAVFVAGEGDVVARRYRVVRIHQSSVEIEDVLSNNRQTIPLTQG